MVLLICFIGAVVDDWVGGRRMVLLIFFIGAVVDDWVV